MARAYHLGPAGGKAVPRRRRQHRPAPRREACLWPRSSPRGRKSHGRGVLLGGAVPDDTCPSGALAGPEHERRGGPDGHSELSNGCLAVSIFQKDGTKFLPLRDVPGLRRAVRGHADGGGRGRSGPGQLFCREIAAKQHSFLLCLLLEFVLFPTQERWLNPWLVLGFLPGMAAGFLIFLEKCGIMEASSTRRLPYAVPKEN